MSISAKSFNHVGLDDLLMMEWVWEAGYLCSLRLAHQRAKQVVEGSDGDIDRIIWSVRANCVQVSNKLLKEFPALTDEGLVAEFVVAIRRRL